MYSFKVGDKVVRTPIADGWAGIPPGVVCEVTAVTSTAVRLKPVNPGEAPGYKREATHSTASIQLVDTVDPHAPGAKLDAGKPRMSLVLGGFSKALTAVAEVGSYGAQKYSDNGWKSVDKGQERYTDALLRHLLAHESGETHDPETQLNHLAHVAWNALAILHFELNKKDQT